MHVTTDTAKTLSDYICESRRNVFSYCKKNQETRLCVTFILQKFVSGKGLQSLQTENSREQARKKETQFMPVSEGSSGYC